MKYALVFSALLSLSPAAMASEISAEKYNLECLVRTNGTSGWEVLVKKVKPIEVDTSGEMTSTKFTRLNFKAKARSGELLEIESLAQVRITTTEFDGRTFVDKMASAHHSIQIPSRNLTLTQMAAMADPDESRNAYVTSSANTFNFSDIEQMFIVTCSVVKGQ